MYETMNHAFLPIICPSNDLCVYKLRVDCNLLTLKCGLFF